MLEPIPEAMTLPRGWLAGGVGCGLKADGQLDLGLLVADEPMAASALFTRNRLVGSHIPVCREHLAAGGGLVRAVLVNSKNANCATGEAGVRDARDCCTALAERLSCPTEQVLMISTGVIGAPLPRERIISHLDHLIAAANAKTGSMDFARAIMTTDTYPKAMTRTVAGSVNRVSGFAKGSGMIHPDLATMLAFYLTDQPCGDAEAARQLLESVTARSMHRVTVDGDTSPNDTVLLLHPGTDPAPTATPPVAPLTELAQDLARHIAADGEGASRLVTIEVRGAESETDATTVGRVIATSPLVKTAIAGRDPNWGRIISAAGRAGIQFDPDMARVWVGPAEVYRHGRPAPENEQLGSQHLREERSIRIGVDLGMGTAAADVWTCDLTADYIRINADYRT